ncbi:sulfatase family protein [Actinophytocola algeriensis]|uniref:Putative sulfatase n=1 Tax=Actinophytocola algeriensis TaxID=1768010 RepID=A0A7W7Q304_9PSEU|nr:sulfatase [Actinophytocola algeriensis]MBB4906009.1 putative sulfatase [Actinophytocola algeriensis]MBE1472306.1 putative sulfatase [Actinophytocola algeriensis]
MSDQRPNIVLVVMDDLGYGDLSCMGNTILRTPRIDSIAGDGITLRHMYATSAVCTPSRAALMTGRYPQRVGLPKVLSPEHGTGLSSWEYTLPRMLHDAGYRTAMFGKWHLGCRPEHYPTRHGFDEYAGLLYSNDMHPVELFEGDRISTADVDQATLTSTYTDHAIDFIRRNADAPFFVYLAHTMPHIPLHVEDEFAGRSAGGRYGDVVESLDHHIGRLLDTLGDLGLADDTIVMVTSDNGPWFEGSTGGLRGTKLHTYEGGIRVPFVARWPGRIPAGSVSDEPACLFDLLPTLAAQAGGAVRQDRPVDGVDISAVLTGGQAPAPRTLYFFHWWTLNAVREGPWKLHLDRHPRDLNRAQGKELPQLFNLELDPAESYDLSHGHPEVVGHLTGLAARFEAEIAEQRPAAEARAAGRATVG